MDAAEDPPDGEWVAAPASVFYGLWPRFAADGDRAPGDPEPLADAVC